MLSFFHRLMGRGQRLRSSSSGGDPQQPSPDSSPLHSSSPGRQQLQGQGGATAPSLLLLPPPRPGTPATSDKEEETGSLDCLQDEPLLGVLASGPDGEGSPCRVGGASLVGSGGGTPVPDKQHLASLKGRPRAGRRQPAGGLQEAKEGSTGVAAAADCLTPVRPQRSDFNINYKPGSPNGKVHVVPRLYSTEGEEVERTQSLQRRVPMPEGQFFEKADRGSSLNLSLESSEVCTETSSADEEEGDHLLKSSPFNKASRETLPRWSKLLNMYSTSKRSSRSMVRSRNTRDKEFGSSRSTEEVRRSKRRIRSPDKFKHFV